jgi:hypothetical protein
MQKLFDFIFTEDEALGARTLVSCGVVSYAAALLAPLFTGATFVVLVVIMVVTLTLLCYAALRELLPLLDPRDPDADRFVVFGALLIFLAIGWTGFGIFFVPGLVLGMALLWWRAPDLLEVIPFLEKPGDTGLRR